MAKAYLSLGSNIGNKMDYLQKAVSYLEDNEQITIITKSSYYETAPVLYKKQDRFINQVVLIDTSLTPYELLDYCHDIENLLDRKREIRYGPRSIDLDILLYGNLVLKDETLTIPHPRMKERAFVLIPLYEINEELIIIDEPLKDLVFKIVKDLQVDDIKKL